MTSRYSYSFPKVPLHPPGLHFCRRQAEDGKGSQGPWYWQERLYVQLTEKAIVFLSRPTSTTQTSENEPPIVRILWEIPLDGSAESDEAILSLYGDTRTPMDIDESGSGSEELHLHDILPPFLVWLFRDDTYEFRNPWADLVREKVLGSPMLSAIYRKENYRWLRDRYEHADENDGALGVAFWRRYGIAEREWFAFCSNRAHEHLFGRGWLGYVEDEVQAISYFCTLPSFYPSEKKSREATVAIPFHCMTRFHLYRVKRLLGYPVSLTLGSSRLAGDSPSANTELVFVNQTQTAMVHWYLRRYNLNSVFVMLRVKMLCFAIYVFLKLSHLTTARCNKALVTKRSPLRVLIVNVGKGLWLSGNAIIACMGLWFACLVWYILSNVHRLVLPFPCVSRVICDTWKLSILLAVWYTFCILLAVRWTLFSKTPNTIPTSSHQLVRGIPYRPVSIYYLALLVFVLGDIVICFFGQGKFSSLFWILSVHTVLLGLLYVVMLAVPYLMWWMLLVGYWLLRGPKRSCEPRVEGQQFLLVIQACLPRLVFGIIGGWIALAGTGEFWTPFLLSDFLDFLRIGLPLLLVVMFLAMVEINNQISSFGRSLIRASALTVVTFALSCFVGFIVFCLSMDYSVYHDELFTLTESKESSIRSAPEVRHDLGIGPPPSPSAHCQLSPRLVRLLTSKGILGRDPVQFPVTTTREDVWQLLTHIYWTDPDNPARIKSYAEHLSSPQRGVTQTVDGQDPCSENSTIAARRPFSSLPVRYAYCLKSITQEGKCVYLLPGLILQFASFAVFIAVALQLIFDDKRITEPI